MGNEYLTIPESINRIINAKTADVNTGLPAQVLSFDQESQTIEVLPMHVDTIEIDTADEAIERGFKPLPDVPVIFPRGGQAAITFPLVKGDQVFLHFSSRSLDEWYNSGGTQSIKPSDPRAHDISDCVASPGPATLQTALSGERFKANGLVISYGNGTQVQVLDNEIVLKAATVKAGSDSAASPSAVGPVVKTQIGLIATKLDVIAGIFGIPPVQPLPGEINSRVLKTND